MCGQPSTSNGPTPMVLSNFEIRPRTKAQREQHRKDLENGACFTCLKKVCKPWKHVGQANNAEINEDSDAQDISSETSSEN